MKERRTSTGNLPGYAGLAKKDFVSKVVGLESHTFDVGEAKYAAKYQKSVDAIALQGRT